MKKIHTSRALLATMAAGVLLFSACGSDDDSSSAITVAETAAAAETTAVAETTVAPETTAASETTAAAETTAAPETTVGQTPDEITADVTAAYIAVYRQNQNDPQFIENAVAHDETLVELRAKETAPKVDVIVKSVTPLSDADCDAAAVTTPCASVVFDISFEGVVAIPDNNGYAVRVDGVWMVSDVTFCSIASISIAAPAGC